jgi:hypothetical protein
MRKLLLFVFALLAYVSSFGQSQLLGGEIYYKQLDSFKYELTAQIYRDCRGSSLNSINGFVFSGNIKLPLYFKRNSIENISENCGTSCQNSNSASNAGIEKHVFKDTIDFTQAPYDTLLKNSYCEINFGVFTQGWNNGITTINNPNFFIDAMVNICHQKAFIYSPEFSNKPLFQACCNQPLKYNPGILKFEDTDSFSFELAGVLDNYNTNAVYNWNLTKTIPMAPYCPPNPGVVNCRGRPNDNPPTGFYFDNIVSDIVFTSTNCNGGLGVIKFQVKQWQYNTQTQKMEIVGYINRQTLVETNTCINNIPPYFSSKTTPPKFSLIDNIYNVCDGDSLILNIASKDDPYSPNQNTYDTTHISWSNNLDYASFTYLDSTAREKTAVLKWKATGNPYQITQKYIHLKTVDKKCNVQASKGILINIYPKIDFKISSKDIKGCNKYQISTQINDTINIPKNFTYTFTVWNKESNIPITIKSKQNDTFQYFKSGEYIIKYEVKYNNINCSYIQFDTINLQYLGIFENNISDSIICQNDSLILGNRFFKDSLTSIWWEHPKGKNLTNYNKPFFIHNKKLNTAYYKLNVKNANCTNSFESLIKTKSGFDFSNYNGDTFVCENKLFKINLLNIDTSNQLKLYWYFNNQLINNPNTFFENTYNQYTTVKVINTNNQYCAYEKEVKIDISPIKNFSFDKAIFCKKTTQLITPQINFPLSYISSFKWYVNNNFVSNDKNLSFLFIDDAFTKLVLSDKFGCVSEKTIYLNTFPNSNVQITGLLDYNYHDYVKLSANEDFNSYLWNNNTTSKNNEFWAKSLGPPGQYPIKLTVKDSNACEATHTAVINTDKFTSITNKTMQSLQIYPNPSDGLFTVESNISGMMELFNIDGQLLLNIFIQEGKNTLNLETFSEGIYFLKFEGKAYKLVVQN